MLQTGRVRVSVLPPESVLTMLQHDGNHAGRGLPDVNGHEDVSSCVASISASIAIAGGLLGATVDLADKWLSSTGSRWKPTRMRSGSSLLWRRRGVVREATLRMACLRDGVFEDRVVWGRVLDV